MNYKPLIIGIALIAAPLTLVALSPNNHNELAITLAQEADRQGNNNDQLEWAEIQDVYRRMGLNPDTLNLSAYERLHVSNDPEVAKLEGNRSWEYRLPMTSDLERGIESYRSTKK